MKTNPLFSNFPLDDVAVMLHTVVMKQGRPSAAAAYNTALQGLLQTIATLEDASIGDEFSSAAMWADTTKDLLAIHQAVTAIKADPERAAALFDAWQDSRCDEGW